MRLSTLRYWLLLIVLFGGACALHPSLKIAIFDFPSLRIGVYQLAGLGLLLTALPLFWQHAAHLIKHRLLLFGATLILVASSVGLVFSYSHFRSLLYASSFYVLLVIGLAAGLAYKHATPQQKKHLVQVGLWSGVVWGLLAIGQLVIASFDSTALGTLCRGCLAHVFGFPRINVLAAEPQFLASSLLPSFFIAVCFARQRIARWSLFFSSVGIALTFSRGAFVAVCGAGLAYGLWLLLSRQTRVVPLRAIAIILIGFVTGFCMLITAAVLRHPTAPHIAYNTAVSMVDQLSVGSIKLPPQTISAPPRAAPDQPPPETTSRDTFTPAGHVAASSQERLEAAQLALAAWQTEPRTILTGVGLGNLGPFLQQRHNQAVPTDQTVYIMYILLLSSLGIMGTIPLVAALLTAIWQRRARLAEPLAASSFMLGVAFLCHFWFFGSLINTIHCFAWIGLMLYNYREPYAKKL